MKLFLCVIGMVFIIEGIPYFLSPLRWKEMLMKIDEMSETWLRLLGLMSILLGLFFVYLGRR